MVALRDVGLVIAIAAVTATAVLAVPGGIDIGAGRPNVILVSIDTLRADRLPCYGHDRNTAPVLCAFANESIVYDQAISQAVWTRPSHASIFTSQYVDVHRVDDLNASLHDTDRLLTEALSDAGYTTAAFVGSRRDNLTRGEGAGDLRPKYGFDQGFDRYYARGESFTRTIPPAQDWLRSSPDEPFFLFLHGYDVHSPYESPYEHRFSTNYSGIVDDYWLDFGVDNSPRYEQFILDDIRRRNGSYVLLRENRTIPLTEEDIKHIRAHYDGGIRYTDSLLADFFSTLRETGALEDSIVIVLSDHGEGLGEKEVPRVNYLYGHSKPWDNTVHVPLIVRIPGEEPRRIPQQVELIDVMPTILDMAGISPDDDLETRMQGDLLPFQPREPGGRYTYTFPEAVRTNDWKYINNRQGVRDELYHLMVDPDETTNLFGDYPNVTRRLQDNRDQWNERKRQLRARLLD